LRAKASPAVVVVWCIAVVIK